MDEASMNRYEKQLYTVFKTFDVDNEEALDRSAVHELCDALQLEDRGAALVNTLFERRSDRVTFAQFRNGLLAVLGGAAADGTRSAVVPPAPPAPPAPPPLPDPPPHHSDEDSSGREVAPKFVFGSKKYGRRSRPARSGTTTDEPASPRSSSASRLDTEDKRVRQRMRYRRSASAMESRDENSGVDAGHDDATSTDTFEHDSRIDRDEALTLCRNLKMDGIDRRLVERIFEESGTSETTVGEFFDCLNASLSTTIDEATRDVRAPATSSDCGADVPDDEAAAGLPSDLVLEAWERAGVQQPRRLLVELGFGAATLRPPELERALDDELCALDEPVEEPRDPRALLLVAALALSRLRLDLTRRRVNLTTAERDKLRGDVAEANRHARVLAQEVDESHARIEADLKASLRRAEARHMEASRHAAAENAAERERAATARAKLEAEVARRADAEVRLRTELAALRSSADEAESRAVAAEERCAEGERERARLAGALREALEHGAAARDCGAEPGQLAARLEELRRDNQRLRDRNDELCAALEAGARRGPGSDPARSGDLSAELDSLLTHDRCEDCDSSPVSIDQRIVGHVEAVTKLRGILGSVHNLARPSEQGCPSCSSVSDAVRLVQERVRELGEAVICAEPLRCAADAAAQTDAADQPADSDTLRVNLIEVQRKHDNEKLKLTGLVKDLETSLEQMKAEYDKCEEYWSGKLEEEREMYAEEQRLGDERLAELVAKIGEYERQFASAPALPTIDERHSLEAQFTDLDEEFARYRRDAERELAARAAELARAGARAAALERRLDELRAAPRPAGEARELRARTARAEAAARRLLARLAAADLLVKDLYVENCQLAHRRPL